MGGAASPSLHHRIWAAASAVSFQAGVIKATLTLTIVDLLAETDYSTPRVEQSLISPTTTIDSSFAKYSANKNAS